MATATKTPARQQQDGDVKVLRSVQDAIDELDLVRTQTQEDVRKHIDQAMERMRGAADDLRSRTDERTTQVEKSITDFADDVWQQLATLSIRQLRDPQALTALSAEIKDRRAELRPRAKRPAAKRTPASAAR